MRIAYPRRLLDDLVADLRYAARALARSPAFAATAIVILALGIGANTALFGAVKRLLLDRLDVPRPEELVRLRFTGHHFGIRNRSDYGNVADTAAGERAQATFSYPVFEQLRADNRTLAAMFASAPVVLSVVVGEEAEVADGVLVSGGYFDVLGVEVLLGRPIAEEDDDRAASPVAVISHRFWLRRFGGDTSAIGRVISVNDVAVTIVGVLPPQYRGAQRPDGRAADLHLPLLLAPQLLREGEQQFDASWWWLQVMGRLEAGSTAEQAQADLGGSFAAQMEAGRADALASLPPDARVGLDAEADRAIPRLLVDSGSRGIYDPDPREARQLLVLGVVVALVLLIVCTNLANLLLSRAAGRRREIAVRRSVGATRARVVRQLVTEGVMLAALGAGLGVLVAVAARRWLPFAPAAPLDLGTFAFVAALALVTGLAFSVVPALRATGAETADALKEGSRTFARAHSLLASTLLVVQVALSVVLLVGAGLFLATLANLRAVDVGFDPRSVLLFRVDPRLTGYDDERVAAVHERLTESLRSLPGVRSVASSSLAFLSGHLSMTGIHVEGDASQFGYQTHLNLVSPDFFATMGIALLAGRSFEDGDRHGAPPVAIVNETAARDYFGDRGAVGRRFGGPQARGEVEVIGVVRDVKYRDVREPAPPTLYRPLAQQPPGSRVYEVKTDVVPLTLAPAVRRAVRQVDPNLALVELSTQEEQIERRLARERQLALAYSLFGGLAMLLAAVGLFGLASYGVVQRTHEIGIRMALGARGSEVTRMILRESLLLVAIGVALGVAGALVAGRLIEAMLFELTPTDTLTMARAVALLVAVAGLAAWLPARRAARVDPLVALRSE